MTVRRFPAGLAMSCVAALLVACTGPNPLFLRVLPALPDGGAGDLSVTDLGPPPEAPTSPPDLPGTPDVPPVDQDAGPDLGVPIDGAGPADVDPMIEASPPVDVVPPADVAPPVPDATADLAAEVSVDSVPPVVDAGVSDTAPFVDAAVSIRMGLVGYWPFDEGSGRVAHDRSSLGNDGQLKTGTDWVASGCPALVGNSGCLSFDGIDSEVQAPAVGLPDIGAAKAISLWAWFPIPLPANVRKNLVAFSRDIDNPAGIQFGFDSGRAALWLRGENTNLLLSSVLPEQKWHHLAYVFDGTLHQLYVNGSLVDSSSQAKDVGVANDLFFGSYGGNTQHFPGRMDDIRFYNRRLDATEVATLAQGR